MIGLLNIVNVYVSVGEKIILYNVCIKGVAQSSNVFLLQSCSLHSFIFTI